MLRYILRRLLLLIPLLLAASAIIFLLLRLGAGDPALDYLRLSNLPPTEEMVASTRELLGLNQPLAMQYLHWLWRALHLDFGLSYATQRPVLDDLLHFLPATLLLTGAALALVNFLRIIIFTNTSMMIAAVVSVTLFCTVIIAMIVGCLLPIGAKKIGFDPAVMASPMITTIVDACSLMIYFLIASTMLGL